jgi:prepilin-type N-terminal cleavage/methylation domain-containing protein
MKIMTKSKFKKGFTLLELLVVISILALLMAMGLVAFSTAQQRGRDSKRRGDIKATQNAFEQYFVVNGSEYAACNTMAASQMSEGELPTDPKPSQSYTCTVDTVANTYCVCAQLEQSNAGNSTNSSCSYGTGDYYCVSNLQ